MPPKLPAGSQPNFDKDHGAVRFLQNEVNFTAAPSRRSIIAVQQAQALLLKKKKRCIFCSIALLLCTGLALSDWIEEHH